MSSSHFCWANSAVQITSARNTSHSGDLASSRWTNWLRCSSAEVGNSSIFAVRPSPPYFALKSLTAAVLLPAVSLPRQYVTLPFASCEAASVGAFLIPLMAAVACVDAPPPPPVLPLSSLLPHATTNDASASTRAIAHVLRHIIERILLLLRVGSGRARPYHRNAQIGSSSMDSSSSCVQLCRELQVTCGCSAYASAMSRRLAEVAAKVGVSEATVSRVLNEKPGVSDATRQAVLTALDVLGYERPAKLRGDRGRLVGLVLPELQNPIFPAFAEVMGAVLVQRGFIPLLCTQTAGGIPEADYVELLLQHHVSGVVFAGGNHAQEGAGHDHYARLAERGLPTVLINASVDDLPFSRVSCDDRVAAEQAMGHLLSLGHAEIGVLLGKPDHVPSQRKLEGARAFAERNGMIELPDS